MVKALQVGRTRDRFQAVTLGIYSVAADISVCRGVDSASKNEYQGIPGGKGGRCVRVRTLPPSCAECLVIWNLNRPEPSGPHKGCFLRVELLNGVRKMFGIRYM